jgi:hypothetical protein
MISFILKFISREIQNVKSLIQRRNWGTAFNWNVSYSQSEDFWICDLTQTHDISSQKLHRSKNNVQPHNIEIPSIVQLDSAVWPSVYNIHITATFQILSFQSNLTTTIVSEQSKCIHKKNKVKMIKEKLQK